MTTTRLARFFIQTNAFLAAQKILATDPNAELPEALLAEAWQTLFDLSGRARPVESWTPGAWARYQAVSR